MKQNDEEKARCPPGAGKIEEEVFVDMARRYLASIPAPPGAEVARVQDVRPLAIAFPQRPVTLKVPVHMMEPRAQVQVAFPVDVCLPTSADLSAL